MSALAPFLPPNLLPAPAPALAIDSQCSSPLTLPPTSGCQTHLASRALAAKWSLDSDFASTHALTFYRSLDCHAPCDSPDLLAASHDSDEDTAGAASWAAEESAMQSYSLATLDASASADGAVPSRHSGVHHGATIVSRDRAWRLWQVARGWFLDVPSEAWDAAIHVPGEASVDEADAPHGWIRAVGGEGELKKWFNPPQEVEPMLRPKYVPLEWWDEEFEVEPYGVLMVDDLMPGGPGMMGEEMDRLWAWETEVVLSGGLEGGGGRVCF